MVGSGLASPVQGAVNVPSTRISKTEIIRDMQICCGRKEETFIFNIRLIHGKDGSPRIRTCRRLFVRTSSTGIPSFSKNGQKQIPKMDVCGQINWRAGHTHANTEENTDLKIRTYMYVGLHVSTPLQQVQATHDSFLRSLHSPVTVSVPVQCSTRLHSRLVLYVMHLATWMR